MIHHILNTPCYPAPMTAPAAGANWIYTIPHDVIVVPESIRVGFTADANVANRLIYFSYTDAGGNVIFQSNYTSAIVAGKACTIDFAAFPTYVNDTTHNYYQIPLPFPLTFISAYKLRVNAENIQATDTFTPIYLNARTYSLQY